MLQVPATILVERRTDVRTSPFSSRPRATTTRSKHTKTTRRQVVVACGRETKERRYEDSLPLLLCRLPTVLSSRCNCRGTDSVHHLVFVRNDDEYEQNEQSVSCQSTQFQYWTRCLAARLCFRPSQKISNVKKTKGDSFESRDFFPLQESTQFQYLTQCFAAF